MKRRDRSAIKYRMRLADRIGSGNAAANLQDWVERFAPKVDPTTDVPRTWPELMQMAATMDSLSLGEGQERFGDESLDGKFELRRGATWLLGEHGVTKGVTYSDFKYRWE